ncbi:MAG: nucleotidyltransferase domain-containing protein [Acidobacteria bacterium]|nr:nucleotidyltransferase domain-containing protein [Acidobacteriota bacterium]
MAALSGRSQARVVAAAILEYAERHAEDLGRGLNDARETLTPYRTRSRREGDLRETLRAARADILAAAARHGARRVRVFGSAARGAGGPESDVDLLVDLEPGRSLLDQVELQQELELLLGRPVDLVEPEGLHPAIRDRVLAEAVEL